LRPSTAARASSSLLVTTADGSRSLARSVRSRVVGRRAARRDPVPPPASRSGGGTRPRRRGPLASLRRRDRDWSRAGISMPVPTGQRRCPEAARPKRVSRGHHPRWTRNRPDRCAGGVAPHWPGRSGNLRDGIRRGHDAAPRRGTGPRTGRSGRAGRGCHPCLRLQCRQLGHAPRVRAGAAPPRRLPKRPSGAIGCCSTTNPAAHVGVRPGNTEVPRGQRCGDASVRLQPRGVPCLDNPRHPAAPKTWRRPSPAPRTISSTSSREPWRHVKKDGTRIDVEVNFARPRLRRPAGAFLSWAEDVTSRLASEGPTPSSSPLLTRSPAWPTGRWCSTGSRTRSAGARRRGTTVAVLVLDVDRFKVVNDAHGQDVGDEVLRCLATRLTELVGPGDTIRASVGQRVRHRV